MYKKHFLPMAMIVTLVIWMATTSSQAMGNEKTTIDSSIPSGHWYVTPQGDDGNDCLIPSAPCASINSILDKPGFMEGDTILTSIGVYTATTGSEVVIINKEVMLSGGWDNTFSSQAGLSTIDGNAARRGITIMDGVTASVDRFVVQNGVVFHDVGAGIKNQGNLTLTNSIIQNNITDDFSGGSAGGMYNSGTLNLENVSIKNNTSLGVAGGLFNDGGSVVMNQSSINNNTASGYGGGIYNSSLGMLVANNSTISGNRAGTLNLGGGIHNGFPDTGIVYLNNSTITNNISNGILTYSDTVTLQNTILAGNFQSDGTSPLECIGEVQSAGYNLLGTTTNCDFSSTTGDLLNVNPRLIPLLGNPAYHSLASDSPAINAGNLGGCKDNLGNPLPTDQRGAPRLGRCDMGAFEYNPAFRIGYSCWMAIVNNACKPVYSDDFSNPDSGWPKEDTGDILYEYFNNEYRIMLRYDYLFAGARPGFQATNYNVSVDLQNINNKFGSYGIVFGLSSDWAEFFTLEIYPDGWFGIYRYDPNSYSILAEAYSGAILQGSAINHIKVTRSGSTINAYANGQLLSSVTDSTYAGSRYLGLIAFSYDELILDIRFDNFTVYPIYCPDYNANQILSGDLSSYSGPQILSTDRSSNGQVKHQP